MVSDGRDIFLCVCGVSETRNSRDLEFFRMCLIFG